MKALLFIALFAGLALHAHAWKCSQEHGHCIDRHHVCLDGYKYECQSKDDCGCRGKWPCKSSSGGDDDRHNGGACQKKDYSCVSNTHFCQAGIKMACAPGTWCNYHRRRNESPCTITTPPRVDKCHTHGCINKRSYCADGKVHRCNRGYECHDHRCVKAV